MKHEITTLNTKKTLAESLKKAMGNKPFSKVTVSEIIRDSGVNRKTFYYHFDDIYALLKWMFEEEAVEVVKNFDLMVDYEEAISFVMDYVEKNNHIINCAYDSIGREEMKRFFYWDFIELVSSVIDSAEKRLGVSTDEDFKLFLSKFYTEALAGMLIDWIKDKDNQDRKKVIEYISFIFKVSLTNILSESSNKG